ncbi:hypothetical protein M231_05627 [Tremella mesenterica]|uniref:Uncharacterized protein n=1 Tax=Tremella mesenterica TaxID=5217 RepID=A0A4Q1BHM3_TREME|nr:hypothetical protein M231_05627 [Tremella mesenterica]
MTLSPERGPLDGFVCLAVNVHHMGMCTEMGSDMGTGTGLGDDGKRQQKVVLGLVNALPLSDMPTAFILAMPVQPPSTSASASTSEPSGQSRLFAGSIRPDALGEPSVLISLSTDWSSHLPSPTDPTAEAETCVDAAQT